MGDTYVWETHMCGRHMCVGDTCVCDTCVWETHVCVTHVCVRSSPELVCEWDSVVDRFGTQLQCVAVCCSVLQWDRVLDFFLFC